jgi:penicillin-insensitive murein endopeptidase
VHDDHIHVRTACSAEETVAGCENIGPRRPWLSYEAQRPPESDADLALALMQPAEPAPAASGIGVSAKSAP